MKSLRRPSLVTDCVVVAAAVAVDSDELSGSGGAAVLLKMDPARRPRRYSRGGRTPFDQSWSL